MDELVQIRDQISPDIVRLTDSVISVDDRLFSLVNGKELDAFKGQILTLESNLLLTRHDGKLRLTANPGSRELNIGSQRFWATLKSAHQVSKDLLLIQDVNNNWTLTTLFG